MNSSAKTYFVPIKYLQHEFDYWYEGHDPWDLVQIDEEEDSQ